jgi:methionyl-tRNA formyltransferase
MRIVFCGTPAFAVPSLQAILRDPGHEIVAVITQPDRPKGRGQEVTFSPVKETALAAGIPVRQPVKIRTPEAQEVLKTFAPECFVIIAYGQIIPAGLLPISRCGWINLHASLLPKYRGAAPINWAIANGETKTGLTTMRIDAGMDTGDMLLQEEIAILPEERAPQLIARMAQAGAGLMMETLRGLQDGSLSSKKQNDALATYAPILKKEDGRIDWARRAKEIYNRMRGFDPWPGAFTTFRGKSCQLSGEPVVHEPLVREHVVRGSLDHETIAREVGTGAAVAGEVGADENVYAEPGTLLLERGELHVACGDTTVLRVLTVKLEGRGEVSAAEFVNGARLAGEERFGHS